MYQYFSKWLNSGTEKQIALKAIYLGLTIGLICGLLFLILFFNI